MAYMLLERPHTHTHANCTLTQPCTHRYSHRSNLGRYRLDSEVVMTSTPRIRIHIRTFMGYDKLPEEHFC